MSADTADSDVLQSVGIYLDHYISYVDQVPNDLIRDISQIHEMNHRYYRHLRQLETILANTLNGNSSGKNAGPLALQRCLAEIQLIADDKLNLANHLQETLDHRHRVLDHDYKTIAKCSANGTNQLVTPVKTNRDSARHNSSPKSGLSPSYNHAQNGHHHSATSSDEDPPVSKRQQNGGTGGTTRTLEREAARAAAATNTTRSLPKSNSNDSLESVNQEEEEEYNATRRNGRPARERSQSPTPSNKRARRHHHHLDKVGAKSKEQNGHGEKADKHNDQKLSNGSKSRHSSVAQKSPTKGSKVFGKRHSKVTAEPRKKRDPSPDSDDPDEERYCICRGISYGEMIACDTRNCPHGEWFHFSCIKLLKKPKGRWFCPGCRDGNRQNVPLKK